MRDAQGKISPRILSGAGAAPGDALVFTPSKGWHPGTPTSGASLWVGTDAPTDGSVFWYDTDAT